ncbi:MAG: prephenate dehydrogenase/arogenate dehydrogenase family protein [Acidobacteriaceae bacterium]|nr:prephenate dehydrogenase/arogenate dehydrogenase family protein [Acidobacteriaceae bacterium]
MSTRVLIVGTGLIGASIGLALRSLGERFDGEVLGWDPHVQESATALASGALHRVLPNIEDVFERDVADIYVLAAPVLPILDWMERLAPVLGPHQLVTDAGSTKRTICDAAARLYNGAGKASFLAGHPMAGKEAGGAALADAELFHGATWLFTPPIPASPLALQWQAWVEDFGANVREIDATRHDELCAWVSHLPQMLSTALAALLEDTFPGDAVAEVQAVGGRALRETTRLGSSPYSMWRDIALTNTEPIAATLLALEQRLQHLRENLRTPELREEFRTANRFRAQQPRP